MTLRLSTDDIRFINVFESYTGAKVRDCITTDAEKIIVVVEKGQMGLAIGRGGSNIKRLRRILRKEVEVVEHSPDLREFIENVLRPICVRGVKIVERDGKKCVYVSVPSKEKGIAIGKNGQRIKKLKLLLKRNQDIDDVIIK